MELSPQVLGALVRRHRDFQRCEDAVQEALVSASTRWRSDGVPADPRAWLITVANRRFIDSVRADGARRQREERALIAEPIDPMRDTPDPDGLLSRSGEDDTLELMFLCAHPSLSPSSQMALTLRSVGGLTTREIAEAFLVPEATMTRRLTRAKATITEVLASGGRLGGVFGVEFGVEFDSTARSASLGVVRHVLYLVFNEGYSASSGEAHQRRELAAEALRLARLLRRLVPDDNETVGLVALMLLTDARHAARTADDGSLIPLADQDRTRWERSQIEEASALLLATLPRGNVGAYQLQAAIAAVHAEASSVSETDWPQIVGLYRLLEQVAPNPLHSLNRVVAEGEVYGPARALESLAVIEADPVISGHHRVLVVRAHLLDRVGDTGGAAEAYARAARLATNRAEQMHLTKKVRELRAAPD